MTDKQPIYAELPTTSRTGGVYEEGFMLGTCPLYTADQMRAFADADRTQRPAPQPEAAPAVASKAVLTAIRNANLQLVRTGDDAFMLVTLKRAAPQQEVQEPFGYVNTHTGQFFKDVEACRKNNEGHWRTVYTAQPAPSGDAAIEEIIQDANRYRWLRRPLLHAGQGSIVVTMDDRANGKIDRVIYLEALDAAIDAARKEGSN